MYTQCLSNSYLNVRISDKLNPINATFPLNFTGPVLFGLYLISNPEKYTDVIVLVGFLAYGFNDFPSGRLL